MVFFIANKKLLCYNSGQFEGEFMENRNYKVSIRNIYVGDVIGVKPGDIKLTKHYKPLFIRDMEEFNRRLANRSHLKRLMQIEDKTSRTFYKLTHKLHGSWNYLDGVRFRRSMLFALDENRHANDLLYNSPHYPILNISPNDDCLSSDIVVGHYTFEMYELLKYFGYPEEIGYEDALQIRNTFFSCDYALDNCEIFGVIETGEHESSLEIFDSSGKHRTFNDVKEDSPLPECYFTMLRRNKDLYSHIQKCVIDRFIPSEKEGPIRSLGTLKRD